MLDRYLCFVWVAFCITFGDVFGCCRAKVFVHRFVSSSRSEARVKIARLTLTIKLDGNWSSFQLANSAPPLSVTDSAIALFRKDGLREGECGKDWPSSGKVSLQHSCNVLDGVALAVMELVCMEVVQLEHKAPQKL